MFRRESKIYLYIILATLLFSCTNGIDREDKFDLFFKKSKNTIGLEYDSVFKSALDSLKNWRSNKISKYSYLELYPYRLDSLLCFNSFKNKLVGALLINDNNKNKNSGDALIHFYGLKINSRWYFFSGETIVLLRELYQKDTSIPLGFSKLHEIAMNEIFKDYLTQDNKINEKFFSSFKKGPYNTGLKDEKTLEFEYLSYCKELWVEKYAPIKKEDISFTYNKKTKEATISFILQTPDSVNLLPRGYKILFRHKGIDYQGSVCYSWCSENVDWKKNKIACGIIPNVPPDGDVEIYIQELLAVNGRTPEMGPFIFSTKDDDINFKKHIKKQLP